MTFSWRLLFRDGQLVNGAGPMGGVTNLMAEAEAALFMRAGFPPLVVVGPALMRWTVERVVGASGERRYLLLEKPDGATLIVSPDGPVALAERGASVEVVERALAMLVPPARSA